MATRQDNVRTTHSLHWQIAEVVSIRIETPTVRTISLKLPEWVPHLPGQHYDLRLTAPDGYQTQRSYSIASPPEQTGTIDLTIERLEDGEVSTYLHDVLAVGDQVELRGPIGGYFVWTVEVGGPLLLVAGGSGIVPLMAMIRHRQAQGSAIPTCLLYSVRGPNDAIYAPELTQLAQASANFSVITTYTRDHPHDWQGYTRRIDAAMVREVLSVFPHPGRTYICGPSTLVENTAALLVQAGIQGAYIRTERFGPTGV